MLAGFAPAALAAATNVHFKAEASLKATYDSNIYLQDIAPDPVNLQAARAAGLDPVEDNKSSWVTSVLPKLGFEYETGSALHLSAAYAPDVTFYHAAGSEDYVAHRGTFNLGGKLHELAWELLNTATCIDGSREGPTFARPGDVPAVGGIPVRDRRAAFVFRNSFRLTLPLGDFFVRPVASSYIHDFQTKLRSVPPPMRASYVYENYIDRQDVNGGLDLGYRVMDRTDVVLGYRYGRQEQFDGPSGPGGALIDSPYDSSYHRLLAGFEGNPIEQLRLSLMAGPDIRQFPAAAERMFPGFNPDKLLWFLDASATWLATSSDTITFKSTRFEQPAFSSFSVYEDIRTDLLWKHKCSDHLTCSLGFTVYNGDWQRPVQRDDWIFTPGASMAYSFTQHLSAELAYAYEWVDSSISAEVEPLTRSREHTRHLATIGVRYAF